MTVYACRQLQAGIAGAFEAVHDPVRLKAAVTALHRSATAREAGKQSVTGSGSGGSGVGSDAEAVAAIKAEAER